MKVKGVSWFEVVIIFLIIVIFAAAGLGIYSATANENNRVSSGIVIEKDYNAAYTTIQHINQIPMYLHHDEAWYFVIQGEKNEKTVEYRFEVDETTFNKYNVGDKYP